MAFKKFLLQYFVWVMASGLIVWVTVSDSKREEKTTATPAGHLAVTGIQALRYRPDTGFIAVQTVGPKLRTLQVIPELKAGTVGARLIAEFTAPPAGLNMCAVSPGGEAIAIVDDGQLLVQNIRSAAGLKHELPARSQVLKVAWSEAGFIALLFSDSSLHFYDVTALNEIGVVQVPLIGVDDMAVNASFVAAGRRETGAIQVLDVKQLAKPELIEFRSMDRPFESLQLSDAGRLIAHTIAGPVLAEKPIVSNQLAKVVAFDSKERLLLAGDFKQILLVSDGEPVEVAAVPENIKALAASGTHIVYASATGFGALSLHFIPQMDARSSLLVKLWIAVNIALLLGFGVRALITMWRLLKEKEPPAQRLHGQVHLGDLPPPKDLVDALIADECVVVVGEDLSANSSLPPWPRFVRRLADWMSDLNYITDRTLQTVGTLLSKGEPAKAMALIEPQIPRGQLLAFARETYIRAAPLSAIHESISRTPFSGAITGTLDLLLERVVVPEPVYTPEEAGAALRAVQAHSWFILRLRGDWQRESTVKVNPHAGAADHSQQADHIELMSTLLQKRNLLFLGMSVREIGLWLEKAAPQKVEGRDHYALVLTPGSGSSRSAEATCRRNRIHIYSYEISETDRVCAFLSAMTRAYQVALRAQVAGKLRLG